MLSVEMTRAAIRLIEGSDFLLGHADIIAEPMQSGRDLMCLTDMLGVMCGYDEGINKNIQTLRTVYIKGYYLRSIGLMEFESKCEVQNYRSMWEPGFVVMKIGDTKRHFSYVNAWRGGRYNSVITESNLTG